MQQSSVILDLSLRKPRSGKLHDYCDAAVEKLRLQNVFRPHKKVKPALSNFSGLKRVFEKLRFRDELMWTEDLTVEIKLRFQISPVYCGGSLRTFYMLLFSKTRRV